MKTMEIPQRFGVEPLSTDTLDVELPYCPHGPTLLFERYYSDKQPRKFFACALHRDRKGCSFFHWADETITKEKRDRWLAAYQEHQSHIDCERLYTEYQTIRSSPSQQRYHCPQCGVLLLESQLGSHKEHGVRNGISDAELLEPSRLVTPASNKKAQAQFYFSESTVKFLSEELSRLNLTRVLCIGTPRLHEILLKSPQNKSLLLDIDHRYAQFYSSECYQRYNMFNNFFYSPSGESVCRDFLSQSKHDSVAIVVDPPFGGLANVLARSIEKLWAMADSAVPTFLVFPYFNESHILSALPSLWMMDYQVTYENHKHFSADRKKSKPSPVRIFTNIALPGLKLPPSEGYWLCDSCNRYVAENNVHCLKCGCCTSKDGRKYSHCDFCGTCVKPGRVHCSTCSRCELPDHTCGAEHASVGCHICGSLEHKRRDCPEKNPLPSSDTKLTRKRKKGNERSKGQMKRRKLHKNSKKHKSS